MSLDVLGFNKRWKYDRILAVFFGIIYPGIILHGYIEYLTTGFSAYFLRDVIDLSVIIITTILFKFSIVKKRDVMVISLYTVTMAIDYTFIIGYYDPNFEFKYTFLHVQMIFATVVFAAGTLVNLRHLLILNTMNTLFIVFCAFTIGKEYSVLRFVYYGILVSGGGFLAYAGQKVVKSLFRKVKSARALIEEQNEELKKMNAEKDQLFRVMGHDLRTPFHQMNLLVELLEETNDEKERAQYLDLIKQSTSQGHELLEDLLSWGEKNIDQVDICLEKTSISKVVYKTFEFFKFNSGIKDIKLINELPENLKLRISEAMMETVFRNLIGNAIKFSHPKSEIIVKSNVKNSHIEICVMDNGVGISSERLKILFSEDQTLSTSGTDNEQGTGYGLGIVKKLVERQMGSLSIDSELEKGTKVVLTFPMVA